MTRVELEAELDKAGVPKKGRAKSSASVTDIRALVLRLRAGEPPETITVPRKPKSAVELFCQDKIEQGAARASDGVPFLDRRGFSIPPRARVRTSTTVSSLAGQAPRGRGDEDQL